MREAIDDSPHHHPRNTQQMMMLQIGAARWPSNKRCHGEKRGVVSGGGDLIMLIETEKDVEIVERK